MMFERMTNRTEGGIAYTKIPASPSNMVDVGECYTGRIIDRLAAYEDSGLSPEEAHEFAKAKADGRLVVLPEPKNSDYPGLKVKYRVYKAKDNTPVENCFVLRPNKDPAAISALTAYAKTTDNNCLAEDILNWITPDEKVLVLPCKVGNTIYRIISYTCNAVCNKLNACNSFIYKGCKQAEFYVCPGTFQLNDMWWIGKTVFLTREAAEEALGVGE